MKTKTVIRVINRGLINGPKTDLVDFDVPIDYPPKNESQMEKVLRYAKDHNLSLGINVRFGMVDIKLPENKED